MIERIVVSEGPILRSSNGAVEPVDSEKHALEARIARLEDVVASLQDTHHLEERVTEKLSAQITASNQQSASKRNSVSSPNIILDAGRQLLPAALQAMREQTDQADAGARPGLQHHPWLLFDTIAEARAMFRMYFDSSYRVSWIARVTPIVCLVLLIMSWLMIGGIPLIGFILDKIVDLALAFVVYKVLHREVQSYRFAIADLHSMVAYRTVSSNAARSNS